MSRAAWKISALTELLLERVVPLVGDLADRLEQVLELLVIEPREAPERAHEDLVLLRVDRERGVRSS